MTKVWVATYSHKHGIDVRVFSSSEAALRWRNNIADEWWEDELGDRPRPPEPDKLADAYFDHVESEGRESFELSSMAVED